MSNMEEQLDRIERKLDALLAAIKTNGTAARSAGGASAGASGATSDGIDVDIDGPRGDPEVRFMPKRWSGTDYKGQKFSACEPEFLDMLADTFEWFAQRDDDAGAVDKNGAPKSKWGRLDAARARAWAARLRGDAAPPSKPRSAPASSNNNRRAPSPPPVSNTRGMSDFGPPMDDDIPF